VRFSQSRAKDVKIVSEDSPGQEPGLQKANILAVSWPDTVLGLSI
jgi:hypothetical protein